MFRAGCAHWVRYAGRRRRADTVEPQAWPRACRTRSARPSACSGSSSSRATRTALSCAPVRIAPGWQPLNLSCPASNRHAIGTRTARPFAHCPVWFAHGPSSFTLAVTVDARSDYAYFADYVVRGGSLASHARILCESRGKGAPFRLVAAAPVDMFAHTPHCELVLTFERCEQRRIPRAPQSQGAARRSGTATAVKGPVP
jgi:hypothetical protein